MGKSYEVSGKDVVKTILELGEGDKNPREPALATVIYKGYFAKTKEIFDSSEEKPVVVELGDPKKIEGFKQAIEKMKKGEKASFKIKPKHAFDAYGAEGKVQIPKGYEDKKAELKKMKIIYEIKLLDFNIRDDIEYNKKLIKTYRKEGKKFKTPRDSDIVKSKIYETILYS